MISVIIPAYNSEKTIRRTLQSVLSQTHTEIEVLVVNDGSKDETLRVAQEIAKTDSRVKVYNTENRGAYKARLHGLANAKGEWITFCDSDDTLPPNAIETLYQEHTKDPNIDIVVGTLNMNNKSIFQHRVSGILNPDDYISAILRGKTSIGPCAKLYRSSLFNVAKMGINQRITQNEDLLMLVMATDKAKAIKILPDKVVYNYLFSPEGESRKRSSLTLWFSLFSLLEDALKTRPALKNALTFYKVNTLYSEGVLKLNDFSEIAGQLKALEQEVGEADIDIESRKKMAEVLSPYRRKVVGTWNMCKLKSKHFIKRILGYER